jgi:hypothetical protein
VTSFRLLLTLFLVLCVSPAWAWWDAGHKIVAAIAFRRLPPEQQQATIALLQTHPRWQQDFVDWLPETLAESDDAAARAEWFFMQASVWADIARNFDEADKARFHRSTWHYVNIPLYFHDADRERLADTLRVNVSMQAPAELQENMNIVQTAVVARRLVADPATPAETRAVLLAWLFHLVGDSHQPMHSTALFSPRLFPEGCRGGNSIKTKPRENLHSLWDSLLGERPSYRTVRNEALKLVADDELRTAGERAARTLDPVVWIRESRELAEAAAYGPEVLAPLRAAELTGDDPPTITLSEEYLSAAGRVARRRVVESGYRLGALLEELTTPAAAAR